MISTIKERICNDIFGQKMRQGLFFLLHWCKTVLRKLKLSAADKVNLICFFYNAKFIILRKYDSHFSESSAEDKCR